MGFFKARHLLAQSHNICAERIEHRCRFVGAVIYRVDPRQRIFG